MICDAIVIVPVDVTFSLIHRRAGNDTILATWMEHFEPHPEEIQSQPYELPVNAPAIEFVEGDELVFRYAGDNSTVGMAFIPVGNPGSEGGRAPNITLPR